MSEGELERIKAVYRGRLARGVERYSLLRPGELYMAQGRERAILGLLRESGFADLSEAKVLEIGCGRGRPLLDWLRWGARPGNLVGIDVMEAMLRDAQALAPAVAVAAASGGSLPFRDGAFDLAIQLTVFSSILDPGTREAVAADMLRVIRRGGAILWYDVRVPNPGNPDLRPLPMREIRSLFPGCAIRARSLTLAPPLARRLARWSFVACDVLSLLPLLRTHYVALIRKPPP